jgi:hypothetical protein
MILKITHISQSRKKNRRNCGLFKIKGQKLYIQDQRDGKTMKREIQLAAKRITKK